MKKVMVVIWVFEAFLTAIPAAAQTVGSTTEQQLENLSEVMEGETEDDSYLQQLGYFVRHPLNLNRATEEDLQAFKMLTPLQIQNFMVYRKQLGSLIDLYELQAVPLWDLAAIRKLLPYISIQGGRSEGVLSRLRQGDHVVMARYARVLEKQRGYNRTLSNGYAGSPDRLLIRYKYQYANLLQYGVVADKDAGEPLFRRGAKGFDFYSFHLFARQLGIIKSLAVGDFAVNLGQGLIQWQSLAFKKSTEAIAVVRQSPVLMPYSSAGEFYFNRGAGLTLQKNRWEATVFGSVRNLSANTEEDPNTGRAYVTSFNASGLHRTPGERADRKQVRQTSFGGNLTYRTTALKLGVNAVQYHFSQPLQKRESPYNLYAIRGQQWGNASVDYTFSYKNVFFFGEAAMDNNKNKALLSGLLASVDPKVDVTLLYRNLDKNYQSLYGNAFTENALPTNESGWYAGLALRPAFAWRLSAYADFFKFPWLKYRVDAPSQGQDYGVQLTYQPNKRLEAYGRYRSEKKAMNEAHGTGAMNAVVPRTRENVRLHFSYKINGATTIKARAEAVWYDKSGQEPEQGWLSFLEGSYKPSTALALNLRLQYFKTDGFNSRIYAYESDVLYSYSIPAFSDAGYRIYGNLNYDINKNISAWIKWSQTKYHNQPTTGSGLDETTGNKKTEIKVQLRYSF